MDCSLPDSSLHGVLQARILEWIATSHSRGSSWPRDRTRISHTEGRFFTVWATMESSLNSGITSKLKDFWNTENENQSILKEINPEYSLEGLLLKLKLQNFGHLIWRANSLEMTLMLGKIEGKRRRGQQRMRWLNNITDSVGMNLSKLQEIVKDRGAWHAAVYGSWRVGHNDWTTTK